MIEPIKFTREKEGKKRMDIRNLYFMKGEKKGQVVARVAESDAYFICYNGNKIYEIVKVEFFLKCLFFKTEEDRDEYLSNKARGAKKQDDTETPPELKGLELYENNVKLLQRWDKLKKSWHLSCPGIDIQAEIRAAHAWEIANPRKQKIDKARFLNGWIKREQDKPKPHVKNHEDEYGINRGL
jgi:hypothetical protein